MRLSIFWRVTLLQSALIALLLGLSLYAITELNRLAHLSSNILGVDTNCIEDEKRLLGIFLGQMRSAEKFLLLHDDAFYKTFLQADTDFTNTTNRILSLVDTPKERQLLATIVTAHSQYSDLFEHAPTQKKAWQEAKTALSDKIIADTDELIRYRETSTARKTATARDQAKAAASIMGWLTLGGLTLTLLLAYFHARGVNRPLKRLAREMHQVGKGEFDRSIELNAPPEVEELAEAFNWMARKLAELDKMKADFMAHVSHELRTPLTAMREGTALLLEEVPGPVTDSQREILGVLETNTEKLFQSISLILDLSKMEAGMLEYQQTPCDIKRLIGAGVQAVELIARKKQIHLKTHFNGDLPLVSLDEQRLFQVLENLLSNALKFTPPGGQVSVNSAVVVEERLPPRQRIEMRVSDTGMGIPAEETERVFERFYQSSLNRGRGQQGTGLGLAIARHIVEAHGGKIWVESEAGKGSTFVVRLPIGDEKTVVSDSENGKLT